MVRAADALVDVLHKAGVRAVFGVPGGAIAALNDALLDRREIKVVTTRHEAGAMFAASGFARATQQVAVVMVTSGPGVLNCMTGLASAFCDGLPVLVIAGEVARAVQGKRALQEGSAAHLNVVGMAKHITKLAMEVSDPNSVAAILRRALATAASGRRGPVLLTIPFDVSAAMITRPGISSDVRVECLIDESLAEKVAGTLMTAHRPVIFAGSGARWGGGPAALLALAERLQIPVMTTPKGKGVFPESHHLSLGVFGHGGHPSASEYLEPGVDVLLAVGTGLSDPATNGWSPLLAASEHFIQVDADALQIGRNYPVSVGLVGPADTVLPAICAKIPSLARPVRRFGVRLASDPREIKPGRPISPPRALWELQEVMPSDTLYTCDIGEHLLFGAHYLHIDDPQGFLIMTGLASMGSGIAGAIGLKLACPDRAVAAICGDGCFAMSIGDVATAVREQVGIVVVVLNDRRYGMVELGHLALYGRTPEYSCRELQIAQLGRAVGAQVEVIESPDQLLSLDIGRRTAAGPLVLDVRIDPDVRAPSHKRFNELARSAGAPQKVLDVVRNSQ